MDLPRLSKSVRRVTVIQKDSAGILTPVVVYKRGRRKKKGTRAFRPAERIARSLVKANNAAARTAWRRYKKSNRKRKDGWVRDMPINILRAARQGVKNVDPTRFLNI
jgi:hypothetical protein